MKMAPLDIVDGSYSDEDKSFSAQDTVNYLPTSAEQGGTRTPTILKTPPGLKPAVLIGVNEGEAGMVVAGAVRNTYNAEGRMFAVAGNRLFQITPSGVSIPIGTIPGVNRVSFAHNQITNGNEILITNGNSGYIYNTVTQVFQRITDTSYPGGLGGVFINNRFVQIEPSRRYAFNSALADGLSYNALDRFTSETSPDLLMALQSIGNQLAVFSTTTTEWFEDTGATNQPFRSTGIVADKGAAGPFATAKLDNQLFFLADDGVFYRYQGYNPVRISTKPIEQAIRDLNWFNAFTTVWEDSGYAVCYWTFPDGQTWGYDASSGKWHRRESYGFNRWRANSLTFWRNAWYAGDFQNGRLWQLDWDYILEGDEEIESIRAAGVVSDNQNRVIHERLELVMDTGMVETVPVPFEDQPEGPSITGNAPDGSLGQPYPGFAYTLSGGSGNYSVTTRSGSLPPGLGSVSAAGVIAALGEPTAVGSYTITLRNTDTSTGLFADHTDTIQVNSYLLAIGAVNGVTNGLSGSANGTSWGTLLTQPINGSYLLGVADGRVLSWNATDVLYSDDLGSSWNNSTGDLTGNGGKLHGAYRPGVIIVGDGISGFAKSLDNGLTITKFAYPAFPQVQYAAFNDDGLLVVASQYENYVSYSNDDALTFSTGANHGVGLSSGGALTSAGSYFVVCGANTGTGKPKVVFTQDGASLVRSVDLNGTAGTFVNAACGALIGDDYVWIFGVNNGDIFYTDDYGLTMTKSVSTMAGRPNACKWNGSVFVMGSGTASDGEIKTSVNGVTWASATQPLLYYVEDIGVAQ